MRPALSHASAATGATQRHRAAGLTLGLALCLGGQAACAFDWPGSDARRAQQAREMWQARCQKAGEFIHRRASGVEGVLLLKLRPDAPNRWDQFALDDPYGGDLGGEGYIQSFLRGAFRADYRDIPAGMPPRRGYLWVEAVDPANGQRYRYTGGMVEPWLRDKNFLPGYQRFEMQRVPATGLQPAARYGVTYEDISTREDRLHWIAGSALRVIDLATGEVMAERIGYMFDALQGNTDRGRQPWSYAADNACPAFDRDLPFRGAQHAVTIKPYQTLDFVEKVLEPVR